MAMLNNQRVRCAIHSVTASCSTSSLGGWSTLVNRPPVGERKFLQITWLKFLAPGNFSNVEVGPWALCLLIILYIYTCELPSKSDTSQQLLLSVIDCFLGGNIAWITVKGFRVHLWQKCFCNTTVVFSHFNRNSYLVGGFNPSEKYEFVSWDDYSILFPIYGKS